MENITWLDRLRILLFPLYLRINDVRFYPISKVNNTPTDSSNLELAHTVVLKDSNDNIIAQIDTYKIKCVYFKLSRYNLKLSKKNVCMLFIKPKEFNADKCVTNLNLLTTIIPFSKDILVRKYIESIIYIYLDILDFEYHTLVSENT